MRSLLSLSYVALIPKARDNGVIRTKIVQRVVPLVLPEEVRQDSSFGMAHDDSYIGMLYFRSDGFNQAIRVVVVTQNEISVLISHA